MLKIQISYTIITCSRRSFEATALYRKDVLYAVQDATSAGSVHVIQQRPRMSANRNARRMSLKVTANLLIGVHVLNRGKC